MSNEKLTNIIEQIKTLIRSNMLRKCYVYPGAIHPHKNVPQVIVPVDKRKAFNMPPAFTFTDYKSESHSKTNYDH